MVIKTGSKVELKYKGMLEDGTIFDTNESSAPLKFEAGKGMLILGMEKAVIGMSKGEKKKLVIPPEEAYGVRNENLIKIFPKSGFPADIKLKGGMHLTLKSPDGRSFPAEIRDVNEKEVVLDLNHQLAGKTLLFEIEIVNAVD